MKGALRVALLLFTALPVQRWLLAGGGLIVAVAYLLPAPWNVLALPGLTIALTPTLFVSGLLLRYIAAPRVTQLIPYVRPQIMGGMAVVTLIFATAFTVVTLAMAPGADHLLIWLRIATGVSAWLIAGFVLVSGGAATGLWFAIMTAVSISLSSAGMRAFFRWIGENPGLLIAVLVASWCGFAIWFLRVRSLSVPSAVNKPFGWGAQQALPNYANAVRGFLFGNPSLAAQLAGGSLFVVVITLGFSLIAAFSGNAHSFGEALAQGVWPAVGVGVYGGLGGWLAAQRSKFLWLRCGLDRRGLFRLCEREAWTCFIVTPVAMLLLVPVVWLTNPPIALQYTLMLVFQLCAGLCLLYLGLMRVRGWRLTDVLIGMVLFFAWCIVSTTPLLRENPRLMLALSGGMLVAAFALRSVALHRWERIDWLVCKPPSPSARNELNPV
jgi:hypothetical protein